MLEALRPMFSAHQVEITSDQILELYAELETEAESREYCEYKTVLRQVTREFGLRLGFDPTPGELRYLSASVKDWLPFPDTISALRALKQRYKLAIISNIDDDLFSFSARKLEVHFDWVITAEQVRSYKPSLNNFQRALDRIDAPPARVLHIAQSIYHDIIPAQQLGLATVWVNRRHGKAGCGATPPAMAEPDLEVPDLETLVRRLDLE